jgi:hypothetical protein
MLRVGCWHALCARCISYLAARASVVQTTLGSIRGGIIVHKGGAMNARIAHAGAYYGIMNLRVRLVCDVRMPANLLGS